MVTSLPRCIYMCIEEKKVRGGETEKEAASAEPNLYRVDILEDVPQIHI